MFINTSTAACFHFKANYLCKALHSGMIGGRPSATMIHTHNRALFKGYSLRVQNARKRPCSFVGLVIEECFAKLEHCVSLLIPNKKTESIEY